MPSNAVKMSLSWYNIIIPVGANGLDGGYEAYVACRGSITT